MRRRALIAGALTAALAAAGAAPAAAQAPRVGLLAFGDCGPGGTLADALAGYGWVEGVNVEFDCVSVVGRLGEIDALAVGLAARRPALVVDTSPLTVRAVQRANRELPIVMALSFDAVREGLVQSLARPGGSVTGVTHATLDLLAKRLQLAREIRPDARRVGLLTRRGADAGYLAVFVPEFRQAAAQAGLEAIDFQAEDTADSARAIAEIARAGADLLYVGDGPAFSGPHAAAVAGHAHAHRLPLVASTPDLAREGALFFYGPDPVESVRKSARFVDRILRGAKPADLPVEQPTRFDLVVNLRTARSLGLTVPSFVLVQADEVIE